MAVVLDIKRRIELSEEPPRPVPGRRLPPMVGPAALYWLGTALVTWAVASGRVPLADALDGMREGQGGDALPAPARRMPTAKPPSRPMRQRRASIALAPPQPDPPEPPPDRSSTGPHLALSDPLAARRFDVPSGPERSEASDVRAFGADESEHANDRALTMRQNTPPLDDRPEPSTPSRAGPTGRASSLGPGLPSCEAARTRAVQDMDMTGAGKRPRDLPRQAFSRVLDDGSYLGGCGVPETMTVDICVAVQSGRVVGVTVSTEPASDRVGRCVAASVARLGFPSSPHLDVATTRFDALR